MDSASGLLSARQGRLPISPVTLTWSLRGVGISRHLDIERTGADNCTSIRVFVRYPRLLIQLGLEKVEHTSDSGAGGIRAWIRGCEGGRHGRDQPDRVLALIMRLLVLRGGVLYRCTHSSLKTSALLIPSRHVSSFMVQIVQWLPEGKEASAFPYGRPIPL